MSETHPHTIFWPMTDRCRICLEEEGADERRLVRPCSCKEGVHEDCMQQWLEKRPTIGQGQCEVCTGVIRGGYSIVGVRWANLPLLVAMVLILTVSAQIACCGLMLVSNATASTRLLGLVSYLRILQCTFFALLYLQTIEAFCMHFHRGVQCGFLMCCLWPGFIGMQLLLEFILYHIGVHEDITFSRASIQADYFAAQLVVFGYVLDRGTRQTISNALEKRQGFLNIDLWLVRRWRAN